MIGKDLEHLTEDAEEEKKRKFQNLRNEMLEQLLKYRISLKPAKDKLEYLLAKIIIFGFKKGKKPKEEGTSKKIFLKYLLQIKNLEELDTLLNKISVLGFIKGQRPEGDNESSKNLFRNEVRLILNL